MSAFTDWIRHIGSWFKDLSRTEKCYYGPPPRYAKDEEYGIILDENILSRNPSETGSAMNQTSQQENRKDTR